MLVTELETPPKKLLDFCASNGITEVPVCEHCGINHVSWDKAYPGNGFVRFCSRECRDAGRSLLIDKDTLFDLRITKSLSWEAIAEMYSVSITPIKKLAKKHGIPEVQYNKSNAMALSLLENSDWLIQKHKTENLKCQEIADLLGVSKSTVSVYLSKHGIQANPANAYPRDTISSSTGCLEVYDFIKSIYSGLVVLNDRIVLEGKEIDIYLPDIGIGFEYNGVWSHLYRPNETTESRIKNRDYHVGKTELALTKGVRLFHIWSIDWSLKRSIWESRIAQLIGAQQNTIFARKCTTVQLSPPESRVFLNEHHLMGDSKASIRYGLVSKESGLLVAAMTFSRPRFSVNCDWELARFCVRGGYSVPGGFSKLLKHFEANNEFSGIVSYADRMVSFGDVYQKNGFVLDRVNKPSYYYVQKNTEVLLHRYKFRKQFITSPGDTRTEREIMSDLGYSVVWDCGTLTFVKSNL